MRVGVVFSQADAGTDPDEIRRFATELEGAGYEHLLAYDHVLGASVDKLGPGPFGAFPEAPYTNEHMFHEVLTLFSHLAAVTTTMQFVTSVVVLPQRKAVLVAKQAATIDLLSGGRLRLAVGAGWNKAEYEGMGASFKNRTAMLEEQIDVMRLLWNEPLVSFEGRFHKLDRVGFNPLPANPIPVIMGTRAADVVLRRVVQKADGWLPLLLPGLDTVSFVDAVRRLHQICEDEGRDPETLPVFGRVYLGPGWQGAVEDALEVGCSDFSVGINRFEHLDDDLADHRRKLIEVRAEIERIVG